MYVNMGNDEKKVHIHMADTKSLQLQKRALGEACRRENL